MVYFPTIETSSGESDNFASFPEEDMRWKSQIFTTEDGQK